MNIKSLLIVPAILQLACLSAIPIPATPTQAGAGAPSTSLFPSTPSATNQPCAQVTTTLNLRAGPNEKARLLNWLHAGNRVTVQAEVGAWRLVTFENWTGYVHSRYLKGCTQ